MSDATYYLTTPLYYVNAPPHLGHAYTTIIADCLARYHRLRGDPVFFLTGTDEHGQKIQQAAAAAGKTPQAFANALVPTFQALWETLTIRPDYFIRTTDATHTAGVQEALRVLQARGAIRKDTYEGWYCTPCETFWPSLTVPPGAAPTCPECHRPVERIQEENYFFPLEPHRRWLVNHIRQDDEFIRPVSRRNEVLAFLEQPLQDLCISRPTARLSWGIPLPSPPFEPGYVTYVWFDALLNYVTAVGYPAVDGRWPAKLHLIGKDILRPHAVYWPIMLHALGLPLPTTIAAHGWWLVGGEKMSKSKGNIVDPQAVVAEYGVDAYRYFLLREVPFGQDGTFSKAAMEKRYTSDLANDLGNLLYRTLTMIEKYCGGVVPNTQPRRGIALPAYEEPEEDFLPGLGTGVHLSKAFGAYDFQFALTIIWTCINQGNAWIDQKKPWVLAKGDEVATQELARVLARLSEFLRALAVWLWPFIPTTSEQMWGQLGCPGKIEDVRWNQAWAPGASAGQRIQKGSPLFPRREPTAR